MGDYHDDDRMAMFVELLTQHQCILYGYIFNLILNAADAEDLLQETNMVLWKKNREYQLGTNFMAWACRIAFLNVQNFLRTKGRNRVCFNNELVSKLSDMQIDRSEINTVHSTLLLHCLGKLSPASQKLLRLCYDGTHSIQSGETTGAAGGERL